MISNYEIHGDENFCFACFDMPSCKCNEYQDQKDENDYEQSRYED